HAPDPPGLARNGAAGGAGGRAGGAGRAGPSRARPRGRAVRAGVRGRPPAAGSGRTRLDLGVRGPARRRGGDGGRAGRRLRRRRARRGRRRRPSRRARSRAGRGRPGGGAVLRRRGQERRRAPDAGAGGARRPDVHGRAPDRRDGLGQGAARAPRAPVVTAARADAGADQLRRDPERADGGRAVRLRARRLHGRGARVRRPARGRRRGGLRADTLRALAAYPWPGNVRELRNVVWETLVYKRAGDEIIPSDLPRRVLRPGATPPQASLIDRGAVARKLAARALNLKDESAALQRAALAEALALTGGNAAEAARLLGAVGRGRAKDPGGTV